MSATLTELQAIVARALRDPDNDTFALSDLTDLINNGITVVSNMAPRQFREDLDGTGSETYELLEGAADERLEIRRVEIWTTVSLGVPDRFKCRVPPASGEYVNASQVGWDWWASELVLPRFYADIAADDTFLVRVWGYAPYTTLVNDDDETDMGTETQYAATEYATLLGYERLIADRALFQKWQGQQNNTDASLAGLNAVVGERRRNWERLRKQLVALRERP